MNAHGAQATDPVANENDCCFGCDYHNCLVTTCDRCEELIGWDWEAANWSHLSPPAGHRAQAAPPEHLAWLKEQRAAHNDGPGVRAQDSPRWCEKCQHYGDHHTDRCTQFDGCQEGSDA